MNIGVGSLLQLRDVRVHALQFHGRSIRLIVYIVVMPFGRMTVSKLESRFCLSLQSYPRPTGWAKFNGANAVSLVVLKCVLENFDNFWQVK